MVAAPLEALKVGGTFVLYRAEYADAPVSVPSGLPIEQLEQRRLRDGAGKLRFGSLEQFGRHSHGAGIGSAGAGGDAWSLGGAQLQSDAAAGRQRGRLL